MNRGKRITIGVTGASGAIYAQRLLQWLDASPEVERIDLVVTQAGVRVANEELGLNLAGTDGRVARELIGRDSEKIVPHSANDIGATIASGSYLSDAMVILPCSMGSLGAIASGVTRDLVHRAADVILKERRLLIIVPRETPLNEIHLYPGENPDDPTMVGVQFDFKSGSVCMLLNAVQMAHDHLTNALGADHD